MKKLKKLKKITNKQLDVMQALWSLDVPLTAAEISKKYPELNPNTVQACIKQLLDKDYIEVADIVYSGTVLCRSYAPLVTKKAYVDAFFADSGNDLNIALNFVKSVKDKDDLEALQIAIDKKRSELNRK